MLDMSIYPEKAKCRHLRNEPLGRKKAWGGSLSNYSGELPSQNEGARRFSLSIGL